MAETLPTRQQDFNEWYNQLVLRADLADYAPVRGCMIVKPYGWALWENIQGALDRRFKATGHVNAAFPLFIPKSFLEKEKQHVEGFSPELAVVTIGGGEELTEPLVVRPTSETIIGHAYAQWIKSYRDLPVLINQWNSVVRWELRTKLFLRTLEFWWQEGHTAHATYDEAEAETRQMLDVYTDFAVNEAAVPVIPGVKSQSEKFAGALHSYTIEAMMGDKRALQAGTSHNLGQNFAKAFNIQYLDRDNQLQHCWTTSWGLSTRFIGAIIMVHGDDQGLILPPRLAPHQVVIVPIYRSDSERSNVLEAAGRVKTQLATGGVRVRLDERDGLTPGFKFNDWEMRGVPLRIEVGPRDLAQRQAILVPRVGGEKRIAPLDRIAEAVFAALADVQQTLSRQAKAFLDSHIVSAATVEEVVAAIAAHRGFVRLQWCGEDACEVTLRRESGASPRLIPVDAPAGACVVCGNRSRHVVYYARGY